MLIVERQSRILEFLREKKSAQIDDLARELDVSGSTIRRDLDALERDGRVERTHGGVIYKGDSAISRIAQGMKNPEAPLIARMDERVTQKGAIGRLAASIVQPQMTLLLDGGSTVVHAARLIQVRPIQVVTNSLAIANVFADDEQVELTVVGGQLYPRSGVMVGPIATGCLAELHADLCLFSLAALHENAAYNINLEMARVEQAMIQQASTSILLMDSSKFGRKSLVRVCGVGEIDRIITDDEVGDEWRRRLGERLMVAP